MQQPMSVAEMMLIHQHANVCDVSLIVMGTDSSILVVQDKNMCRLFGFWAYGMVVVLASV